MSSISTPSVLWESILQELKNIFPTDVFHMWFEPMDCEGLSDDALVITVPNDFASFWVQDNYLDLLTQHASLAAGRTLKVQLKVKEQKTSVVADLGGLDSQEAKTPLEVNREGVARGLSSSQTPSSDRTPSLDRRETPGANVVPKTTGFQLNPKNTFENFVIGPGNQLAHAASIAIASNPGRSYNPLFLYGDTGLGKTHLMHAVAHHAIRNNPNMRVAYVSSEKFTNEFIRSIQENTLVQFRRRYRNVDLLLVDDIHFLSGKESTQEEFFHTFNELFESQKQIFITSDRPAGEIAKLEARLVSRFQWGLVTDIQAPDLETRVAILRKKAESMNISLEDHVLQFLAERVSKNVRRMEGALTRVASYQNLVRGSINGDVLENLLGDILREEAQNKITVEKIQKVVADYYHLRLADMVSKRRPANIAFPRQIAMHLSRMLTPHSLQEIGSQFGGRDHGTVIHACKTVENMMDQDQSVRRAVDYLNKQLAQSG
ncbi:MAG: chromosomal replication initiator protein DnaA [Verrucomicrobiota bacterium]